MDFKKVLKNVAIVTLSIFVILITGILTFQVFYKPIIFGFIPLIYFIVLLFIKPRNLLKKLLYFLPILAFFLILAFIPFTNINKEGYYAEKDCSCIGLTKYVTHGLPGHESVSCIGVAKCECYSFDLETKLKSKIPCDEVEIITI